MEGNATLQLEASENNAVPCSPSQVKDTWLRISISQESMGYGPGDEGGPSPLPGAAASHHSWLEKRSLSSSSPALVQSTSKCTPFLEVP